MSKRKKKKGKAKEESYNPIKDTGEQRPVRVRVAAGEANDKYSEYPSSGLTPRRLAAIFREADEGNVRRQMELFEEMEEKDTHLFSQMQTRKQAVVGLDWEIQPFSDDAQDKQIAEFIDSQLKGLEKLDDVFIDLLDAIGKGISIMELSWGIDRAGHNVIEDIEYVHPKKLIWDGMTDTMLICTKDYPSGIPLPQNKFVVHKYKAKSGHPSRAGVLRVASWMYLFKNYDLKDWVAFCEVFGMPLRLGKYDAAASEEDKAQLMEAILTLGTDAAGIIPSSTIIEFIESQKTTSVEIYEQLARYCDEQISKAILGQTLTSDSGSGSYAQSKTHDEVRHDLTVADAKALATTIRLDIIGPLVEYNFGPDAELPFFAFDCRESDDQKEAAEVYKILACDMGLKIPESHIYKKFNIPKPEAGEPVLSPPDRAAGSSLKETEAAKELSLKAISTEQAQVDGIADIANKQASSMFGAMLQPILDIVDSCESLEALQLALKDADKLQELYGNMLNSDFEDLLHQGMYLAQLIGRARD